jgi:hypothetical protein
MMAIKQLLFSVAFATLAVAAAEFLIWAMNQ